MSANAQSVGQAAGGKKPIKRSFRNYLLDPRFQLKYTGMVVGVTLLVGVVLGALAYRESRAQTEMLTVQWVMEGQTEDFIAEQAAAADRLLLIQISTGILIMVIALGVTGILVTHKVVGPAYKMKLLFEDVVAGHLRVRGKLRKGDELQDVFEAYERMIDILRERQREEIELLARGIENAREAGATDEQLSELEGLKKRMEDALA